MMMMMYQCMNQSHLSRLQHLRNALFDALHQLSGTHYRKLFSVGDLPSQITKELAC